MKFPTEEEVLKAFKTFASHKKDKDNNCIICRESEVYYKENFKFREEVMECVDYAILAEAYGKSSLGMLFLDVFRCAFVIGVLSGSGQGEEGEKL